MNKINIVFNGAIAKITNLNRDIIEAIKYRLDLELSEERYEDLVNKTSLPLTREGNNFYLIRVREKEIEIPTGLLTKVIQLLKAIRLDYSLEKKIQPTLLSNREHIASLREDQLDCVNKALKYKRGIIKAYTRFGKSWVIGDLVNQFDDTVYRLITVPKVDLLYQMREDLAKVLNISKEEIGLIGDSNRLIRPITVAIPDTLALRIQGLDNEIIDYLNKVQVLVIDEVHRNNNPTTLLISDYLRSTEYRLGTSATPYIDNFLILEGMLGPVIFVRTEKEGIKDGSIETPTITFHKLDKEVPLSPRLANFKFDRGVFEGKENKIYHQLYDSVICLNPNRNNLGVEIILRRLEEGRTVLVLVDKIGNTGGVNHAGIIQSLLLEKGVDFPIISGRVKNRKPFFERLGSELPGLIATTGVLTDGLTLPSVSSLVLLCGGSEKRANEDSKKVKDFVQRVGRVLTKSEGKLSPTIDDIIDCQSIFIKQSESRVNAAIKTYGKENVLII